MGKGWLEATVRRLTQWFAPFVGLRDGFLVVSAGLYVIGYFAWSLYAWANGLGLLPVLSAQYVAAGATIGMFLLLAWLATRGLWLARERLHVWFQKPTEPRLTLRWILALVCNLILYAFVFVVLTGIYKHNPFIFPALLFSFAFLVFFAEEVKQPPRWIRVIYVRLARPFRYVKLRQLAQFVLRPGGHRVLRVFYGIYLSVIVPTIFLIFGALSFIYLPRELGGPSPSCIQLDVDKTMLSREAQRELLPDPPASSLNVARTFPLDLMFEGGDSILVRRHDRQPQKDLRVFAIGPKLVTARVDCD